MGLPQTKLIINVLESLRFHEKVMYTFKDSLITISSKIGATTEEYINESGFIKLWKQMDTAARG